MAQIGSLFTSVAHALNEGKSPAEDVTDYFYLATDVGVDLLDGAGIFNNLGSLYGSGWRDAKETTAESYQVVFE